MDKKNKISVIVSAYNTESYIEKCINSLINQSYSNMEIIIVNDCSTDKTREKLVQYENIQNIKIIDNEKNMGLSYSRILHLKIQVEIILDILIQMTIFLKIIMKVY